MNTSFRIPVSTLLFLFLSSFLILTTSCGSDDQEEENENENCSAISTIDGEMTINGETLKLTIAQLSIQSFGDEDSYIVQIAALSNDCLESRIINFSLQIPANTPLSGTYQFKDFFSSDIGDVTGSYIVQKLDTISQSLRDIESGTLMSESQGNNTYSFVINANLVGGDNVMMDITHTF